MCSTFATVSNKQSCSIICIWFFRSCFLQLSNNLTTEAHARETHIYGLMWQYFFGIHMFNDVFMATRQFQFDFQERSLMKIKFNVQAIWSPVNWWITTYISTPLQKLVNGYQHVVPISHRWRILQGTAQPKRRQRRLFYLCCWITVYCLIWSCWPFWPLYHPNLHEGSSWHSSYFYYC